MKRNICVFFLFVLVMTAFKGASYAENEKGSDQRQAQRHEAEVRPKVSRQKTVISHQKSVIASPDESADGILTDKKNRQPGKKDLSEAIKRCSAIRNSASRKICMSNVTRPERTDRNLADCSGINDAIGRKKCQAANKLAVKQSMMANDLDPAARKKLSEQMQVRGNTREWRSCFLEAKKACVEQLPEGSQLGERRKCENTAKTKCGPFPR